MKTSSSFLTIADLLAITALGVPVISASPLYEKTWTRALRSEDATPQVDGKYEEKGSWAPVRALKSKDTYPEADGQYEEKASWAPVRRALSGEDDGKYEEKASWAPVRAL
jgi:hypothetical protein